MHRQYDQGNHKENQGRLAAGEPVVQGGPTAHRLLQGNLFGRTAQAEDGSGTDEDGTQAIVMPWKIIL